MRVLLLFRGAPGCGKSTYIQEHGLKPYTLSADDIRLLCQSPVLTTDGSTAISQNNESTVWKTLFNILETRMSHGEFTVIDATNSKISEMNRYKELALAYRYRIYCIDMTDIPIEVAKERNSNREPLKRVPDSVIDKMYARFETQSIPSGIKVIKPDELDIINYRKSDFSNYEKIHIIGDVHGCYTALMDYINSETDINDPNQCFIFTGDYIDRGIENAEVVEFLCKISIMPNIILLEGNHDQYLRLWSSEIITKSKEFEFITKPQLRNISKKAVRELCRKLGQCCYFTYGDKTFLVTHGGVSNIPENLLTISTDQMIRGVGNYSDVTVVNEAFVNNTADNVYQVYGHRNTEDVPVKSTDRTYNLEGGVEFGNFLRVIQITSDEIKTFEIKNDVFKDTDDTLDEIDNVSSKDMSVYELVETMRKNNLIYEKKFGRISSFNFTKEAFRNNEWSNIVNKARGLFIDTQDYKIVARSYDKFFNINQVPETRLANLRFKLQFPVDVYVKYNGFLGIVGWNPEEDDLLITSKSSITGDFSTYLKDALYKVYSNDTIEKMRTYIKENDVSFIFECCDVEHDLHIVEYPETQVVLLDIIKNKTEYEKLPYDELVKIANNMGFKVKEKAYVIDNWSDFYIWYNQVNVEDYKYNGEYIEGFVIEDTQGYMTKIKLYYYKMWKKLRGVAASVLKHGNYKYTGGLLLPIENEFFAYCKQLHNDLSRENRDELHEEVSTNICHLRNKFLQSRQDYNY